MPTNDTDMKTSWADAVDAEDIGSKLPASTESIDARSGIKTITEYKYNDEDKVVKVVKTIKIETRKVSKAIAKRKGWTKFGGAKGEAAGPNPANTIVSPDEVFMQFIGGKEEQQAVETEDPLQKIRQRPGAGAVQCRLCKGPHWTNRCPYKDQLEDLQESIQKANNPPTSEENQPAEGGAPAAKPGATGGKYIPPAIREGAKRTGESMGYNKGRDEVATIRVTNLSEDTREADLQELFKPFGAIARIYLAKDKVTGQSKGFAFINYYKKEDAAKAIQGVSGYGYDHLILNVEWAKPQADR